MEEDRFIRLLAPIHDRARLSARRLCRNNADGDDLFQEAALRAARRIGDVRDEARFPGWFYQVLLSVHRERTRRGWLRRWLSLDQVPEAATDGAGWEEALHRAQRLRGALQRLPAVQREALVLFTVDGFSIEEIAEMQRSTVSAVKTRLARGRERLRELYEGARAWTNHNAMPRRSLP